MINSTRRMHFLKPFLILAFLSEVSAFCSKLPFKHDVKRCTNMLLLIEGKAIESTVSLASASSAGEHSVLSRRSVMKHATATIFAQSAAVACFPMAASALNTFPADNEIVKEQRTVVDKLDINNAPVADYMQFPGLYPTIGGKIANNGPYASFRDLYKVKAFSKEEIAKIKSYESELTATKATGMDTMRGRDPYRRSFNK